MFRTILISGASSGIGLATARHFIQRDWHVFALSHPADDTTRLDALSPDRVAGIRLDLRDADAIDTAMTELGHLLGGAPLHALVNNAGYTQVGPLELLSMSEIRAQFDVNVFAHLQITQAVLPHLLRAPHPRIVNVNSLMGTVALPALGAYSMSKHALTAMTDVLRLELAPRGIRVVEVQPGAVSTPLTDRMAGDLQAVFDRAEDTEQRADYMGIIAAIQSVLRQQQTSAVSADDVADAIVKAIITPKPKPRYVIGGAARGLMFMRRFSPDAIGDMILRRVLKLPGYPKNR